jgi:hypothetical protein
MYSPARGNRASPTRIIALNARVQRVAAVTMAATTMGKHTLARMPDTRPRNMPVIGPLIRNAINMNRLSGRPIW